MLSRSLPRLSPLFVLGFSLAVVGAADAKTYYIDAVQGNDAWSGESSDPAALGPWQSFGNLAIKGRLVPGDTVLLRCGQIWQTTLKLVDSGTEDAPITVGSYPRDCSDKPMIDGAKLIPAQAWNVGGGGNYLARLPFQMIENYAMSASTDGWRVWSKNSDAKIASDKACPDTPEGCIRFTSGKGGGSLLYSESFALQYSHRYQLSVTVRAPVGQRYSVYVRRAGSPYDNAGVSRVLTGTGEWQTVTLPFVPPAAFENARLDFELPGDVKTVHVKNFRVRRDETAFPIPGLTLLTQNAALQTPAHHPNRGHNAADPESPYYLTSSSSLAVTKEDGRKGSQYFTTGSDLQLPKGATITPGLEVVLRTQNWSLFEHGVTKVDGNKVYVTPETAYPLFHAGWGYYFTGAAWMVDAPREWFYDPGQKALIYRNEGSDAPGGTVAYSTLGDAMDLGYVSHVSVENLMLRNARNGIFAERSGSVSVRAMKIARMALYGIDANASDYFTVTESLIRDTGSDALHGTSADHMTVRGNDILNSGVTFDQMGRPVNQPLPNYGAIHAQNYALIENNRIVNAAYIGIVTKNDSLITDNAVRGYCYLLSDCGGIYLGGATGTVIQNNLVSGGVGNRQGIPKSLQTLVDGVYLDGSNSYVSVVDNVLADGDYGVQTHNGHHNTIQRNVFYANRNNSILLQETGNSERELGNIYENKILDNSFFMTSGGAANRNIAKVENTYDFSIYDANLYSVLFSSFIAAESSQKVSRTFNFNDWRNAVDDQNVSRNLDRYAKVVAPLRGKALGTMGKTLVANGNMSDGTNGWTRQNTTAPVATLSVIDCASKPAPRCLQMQAGGSASDLSSPRFDVTAGQLYRVSFDAAVSKTPQLLQVLARKSGPSSYASVMGAEAVAFNGSVQLKRYSFTFVATETVKRGADNSGVRIDFIGIPADEKLLIGNFEIVQVGGAGDIRHDFVANYGRASASYDCPVEASKPDLCDDYFSFPQGAKISWPLLVEPAKAVVVFTQRSDLNDADNDSVADSQDLCGSTSAGSSANAVGCALEQ